MHGQKMLYLDQYSNKYWASSVKELRAQFGNKRAGKIYRDVRDENTGAIHSHHIGYIISGYWLTAFIPYYSKRKSTKGNR